MKNITYINAGAGTGKTQHLINLFADIVSSGKAKPYEIIMTTFNKRAAAELSERARKALVAIGQADLVAMIDESRINTLHRVAYLLICKYWFRLGLAPHVKVMDEKAREVYMAQSMAYIPTTDEFNQLHDFADHFHITDRHNNPDYDFWEAQLAEIINLSTNYEIDDYAASQAKSLDFARTLFAPGAEADLAKVSDYITLIFNLAQRWRGAYAEFKAQKIVLDYDDVEKFMLQLLNAPETAADVASSYKYIFVDDFQDCSPIQVKIFDRLSELMAHSFWVGDAKQNVYAFRGAASELTKAVMDRIASGADGCSAESLNASWRSLPPIVDVCNKFFAKAFKGVVPAESVELKPVRKMDPSAEPCLRYWDLSRCHSGSEKARQIAAQVADLVAGGVSPHDIAILERTNNSLKEVAAALRSRGVPVDFAQQSVAELPATDLLLALLALVVSTEDVLAKATVVHLTEPGYTLEAIANAIVQHKQDDEEDSSFLDEVGLVKKFAYSGLRFRLRMLTVHAAVETIIIELGLFDQVKKMENPDLQTSCLLALIKASRDFEEGCKVNGTMPSVAAFIDYARTADIRCGEEHNGVSLLTYHRAKGLEWKYVVLSSLDDDSLSNTDRLIRHNILGIHKEYVAQPSPANLYPDVVLRFCPNIFADKISAVNKFAHDAIKASALYKSAAESTRQEQANLLYVGMTRPCDVLILSAASLQWPADVAPRMAQMRPDGDLLGTGNIFADCTLRNIEDVEPRTADTEPATPRIAVPADSGMPPYAPDRDIELKRLLGYGRILGSEIITPGVTPNCDDDAMETVDQCLRHIFALADRCDAASFESLAAHIIENYDLTEALPDASAICATWHDLTAKLTETYGPAKQVHHERSFTASINKFVVSGPIDLVWATDAGDVVVIFETSTITPDDAVDYSNPGFAGIKAARLEGYGEALKASGETVIASLVFYPITGLLVNVGRNEKPFLTTHKGLDKNPEFVIEEVIKAVSFSFECDNFNLENVIEYASKVGETEIVVYQHTDPDNPQPEEEDDDDDDDNFTNFNVGAIVKGKSAQGVDLERQGGGPIKMTLPKFGSSADASVAFSLLVALQNLYHGIKIIGDDGRPIGIVGEEYYTWFFETSLKNVIRMFSVPGTVLRGVTRFYNLNVDYLKSHHPKAVDDTMLALAALHDFAQMQWSYSEYEHSMWGGNGVVNGNIDLGAVEMNGPMGSFCVLRNTAQGSLLENCDIVALMLHDSPIYTRNVDFMAATAKSPYVHRLDIRQAAIDPMPADEWENLCFELALSGNAHPGTLLVIWDGEEQDGVISPVDARANGAMITSFSVGGFPEVRLGDVAFFVKIGADGGALFKCDILSAPYPSVGFGRSVVGIDVWIREDATDCSPVIPFDKLRAALPDVDWSGRTKSVVLDPQSAQTVRGMWSEAKGE